VQRRAATVLRTGADAVIGAATGSGKTLAYLLPLLARLSYPEAAPDESQARCLRTWLSRTQGSKCINTVQARSLSACGNMGTGVHVWVAGPMKGKPRFSSCPSRHGWAAQRPLPGCTHTLCVSRPCSVLNEAACAVSHHGLHAHVHALHR